MRVKQLHIVQKRPAKYRSQNRIFSKTIKKQRINTLEGIAKVAGEAPFLGPIISND